jgi:hypothetical protein
MFGSCGRRLDVLETGQGQSGWRGTVNVVVDVGDQTRYGRNLKLFFYIKVGDFPGGLQPRQFGFHGATSYGQNQHGVKRKRDKVRGLRMNLKKVRGHAFHGHGQQGIDAFYRRRALVFPRTLE